MRRLVLSGLLTAMLLVPAAATGSSRRVETGAGISAVLPAGWRLVRRPVYVGDYASPRVRSSVVRLLDSVRVAARR